MQKTTIYVAPDFVKCETILAASIKAKPRRTTYLSRHLCHSDYYDEQRRVQGKWLGTGAER
jgi:hypothetical protein